MPKSDTSEVPGREPQPGLQLGTQPHPHGVTVDDFYEGDLRAASLHAVKPPSTRAFCGVEVVVWDDTQWPPALDRGCPRCLELVAAWGGDGPPPRPAWMERLTATRRGTAGPPEASDPPAGTDSADEVSSRQVMLARAQGVANLVGGLWPLLSMRSFEAVFGPKTDRWLVRTVAGLLIGNGMVQLRAPRSPDGIAAARRIGTGTAAALGAIDVVYAPSGRISRVYLLDAVLQAGWLVAWLRSTPATPGQARR